MAGRFWTISNLLSFIRIVLVVPIAVFLLSEIPEYRWLALGLMIIAILTDLFDGLLARKFNEVTEFGKIIDPLADKIAIAGISTILLIQNKLALWFVIMIVVRDLLIVLGGLYIRKIKSITLQSNRTGKWAVTIVSLLIVFKVLNDSPGSSIEEILLAASTLMLLASFFLYLRRFIRELQSPRQRA